MAQFSKAAVWVSLILAVILVPITAGQDKSQQHAVGNDQNLKVAQGKVVLELPNEVMHIHQSRNGDYWFGSKHRGVYRYDGKTLVNFTTKDGLSFNHIGGIQEDKVGNIYFTTSSDYDPTRRRFTQGISRFDGKSFSTMVVPERTSPWQLNPDDLWFGGEQDTGSVLRFDGKMFHRMEFPSTKAGEAHLAAHPRSLYPNSKYSPYDPFKIFKDSKGHIWFGTAILGVCRYDGKSFLWIPEEEVRNGSFGTRSIVEDKDGRYWFCNTLHRYEIDDSNPAEPKFKRAEGIRDAKNPNRTPIGGIMSATLDSTGGMWMATYGMGVWRYDGQNATHYPVKDDGKDIQLFSIYRDRQGVIWLGTQKNGVFRLNDKVFEKFSP